MSKKIFENLLKSLKKSNKVRRQALATKNGYATYEDYKAYLEAQIKNPQARIKKVVKKITENSRRRVVFLHYVRKC